MALTPYRMVGEFDHMTGRAERRDYRDCMKLGIEIVETRTRNIMTDMTTTFHECV